MQDQDKPINEEEEFIDDEYIDSENDPQAVEEIRKEDYTIPDNEEVVEFDEVFETVKSQITNLSKYDHMMEKKVLNALRKGELK